VKPSQIVEAILFASEAPLKTDEIVRADESLDEDIVEAALQELRQFYDESERAFGLAEVAEGYQLLTRADYASYLERFDTVPRPSRLSGPALEALAIIAYRQPIGRVEVEYIRGVSSAGVIRSLQDRGLVDVVGRGEGLGRPLLYGTTSRFLEHFGFSSLEVLPRPDELPVVLRDRIPLGSDDDEEEPDPDQLELADGDEPAATAEAEDADEGTEEGEAEPSEGGEDEAEPSEGADLEVADEAEPEAEGEAEAAPETAMESDTEAEPETAERLSS